MKGFKKSLLLVLSLTMSATLFAACGGGGGDDDNGGAGNSSSAGVSIPDGSEVEGEQFAGAAAWSQALADTAAATNATVAMSIKADERAGDMFERYDGTQSAKVADGKMYVSEIYDSSWRFENDGVVDEDSEHDEDQTYIAVVDGVTTVFFKELEGDWQISPYEEGRMDFSATVGYLLDYYAEFNLDFVSDMYQDFTYNNGAYTFAATEDGFENKAELKFVDGQLAWGKISEYGAFDFDGQDATFSLEITFAITYGNATIGALPEQGETPENPDDDKTDSSENGTSSGGGADSSENGDVELPDTSVDIPETDGAPVANADEWNTVFQNTLSATNATIVTTASENGVQMESGVVMIAGGRTYQRWDNMDGSSSYYFYGEVNGQSYRWDSKDGSTWTYEETDWTPDDYATVAYELAGLDKMLVFENATWNADTGMYTGESEEGTFSVKIADGKVVYISFYMESAMMPGVDVVYQIVYGETADINLPPIQDDSGVTPPDIDIEIPDVDGEQVADVTAWNAAWANTNAADNITIIATQTYEGETELCYGMMADGKAYMVYADAYGVYAYEYRGVVDGRNYVWESEDGETWEVEEFFNDIANYTTGAAFVRGLDQMIDYSATSFENGYYAFSEQGMNFKVKMAGGFVVEIHLSDGEGAMAYYMEYGNASVELPPLPQEEEIFGEEIKSAGDWADVITNTLAQTNYTYTAQGRVDRGDGNISILAECTAVDNGKVYVESETRIHSGNGAVMGSGNRYYQGYVDGVAYEWRDIGDGRYYAQEIESVDITDVVTLFGLDDLDFATASFDREMGAYAFSDSGAIIRVKVVNSLICVMEMETGAMTVSYVYTYGDASVELPPLTDNEGGGNGGNGGEIVIPEIDFDGTLGEDIIGQELPEEKFMASIKGTYVQTNFTLRGYTNMGAEVFAINQFADGKMFGYASVAMVNANGSTSMQNQYTYAGWVNGVSYTWVSRDGQNWNVFPADSAGLVGYENGAYMSRYLDLFEYDNCTFSKQTGAYVMTAEDGTTYSLKIVGGLVVYIMVQFEDGQEIYTLEYGTAHVGELPPFDGGNGGTSDAERPTQDEWDMAFERTHASRNYSLRMVQDVQYYDGSRAVASGFFAKITENAVEQEQYQEMTENYVTTKTQRRDVWANEDGENTYYSFSYEDGIWTKGESTVTVDKLHEQMASLFMTFADMYDVVEWNEEGYFYVAEYTMKNADGKTGNTLYNVYIVLEDGYVMGISYEMKYETYGGVLELYFSDYEATKVDIPTDGQGDVGIDNENGDNGNDEGVENDKVIINGTVNFN